MTAPRHPTDAAETLRARLVRDLRPARPYWTPRTRLLVWLAIQAVVLLGAMTMGPRADLAAQMRQWPFVLEVAGLVGLGVAGALLALRSAVPGRQPDRSAIVTLVAGAVGAFVLGLVVLPWGTVGWPLLSGSNCASRTLMIAAVPWITLVVAVARGAAIDPVVAGVLSGLGPMATAAAIMRLMCPVDEGLHVLLWHDAPVVLVVMLSLAVGAVVHTRWARRPAPDR